MKDTELEQLWRQIDQQLDHDDDTDLTTFLADQGIQAALPESVRNQATHLLTQSFAQTAVGAAEFLGKYQIIEPIDSGGQSEVYLAERSDGVYQQTVVIKFINHSFEATEQQQLFLREMQLLADLHHPGVVTIIDGDVTEQGQPWLVLEYIDGPHIDQFCVENELTVTAVVRLFSLLCDSLQFIHQRQVLHKDLKPSNLLVREINGVPHPVLIDFGIAMNVNEKVAMNLGTRGFSAPEQVAGHDLDQRSDLYALGVLFGYLLLAREGQSVTVNDARDIHNALAHSAVPKDLQQMVKQMTAPEPSKRYLSAEAVRSDLNQWLLGHPLSFDHHKLTAVLKKTVKRHPWVTTAMMLVLVLAVWFTAKYTRDTQQLQQLTIAEKHATDELMNFMLDDLFENLERIGRIDVLQSVALKSVDHLAKQDPLTLDQAGHFQTAKAYINTGRVFDHLEQSDQAQDMFQAANEHLIIANQSPGGEMKYLDLLARLRVYQSQVLPSLGQEQLTAAVLEEAIAAMQQLIQINPQADLMPLWEARLELSYHLMEYAHEQQANEQVKMVVELATQQLKQHPQNTSWFLANSQSKQMKAWYELDFGDLQQGIDDIKSAIGFAEKSIQLDPEDLKKQNNLRILYNQLGFFYLSAEHQDAAKAAVMEAIRLGDDLKLKAPFNLEYAREHAYSHTTAGEIQQAEGDLAQALEHFQFSLLVSQNNHQQDPDNYSAANDLAVDTLLVADLKQQLGQQQQAQLMFESVEQLMQPVHAAEPNNKYYTHTLLVTLLHLKQFERAKPLFDATVKNDLVDYAVEQLLVKHQLQHWLTSTKESVGDN
ncbi:serine/threonine-protein kinase [Marinicella sp. S1101]|uniref:serine/threonine-protein kinase n=1 Tax=Marinicella marina TaxID=2996016 RepID=UPI0022608D8E|nr:serine/threonine-protein kinase [Marinicella marina]MCX7553220.1 serine/threonine-protein kinase [Marinicella marina]MDJ1138952.1 serine/threonine-protein kinase [Marinicella marina]